MESLSRWFGHILFPPGEAAGLPVPAGGPVCTVIGSGGKTSLIWLLAKSQRRRKVLVSPTTKMYPPPPELRWYDRYFSGQGLLPEAGAPGISLAGVFNKNTGKLEALPGDALALLIPGYDLTLLEGDGARGLPLKGWAAHEPQVPPCTSVTIGVIPLLPPGKKVSKELVFRLPRFKDLSGAEEGDSLEPAHLAAVIGGPAGTPDSGGQRKGRGLFAAARGRKLLFFNQVEDDARREQARAILALLPEAFRAGLAGIIAGSVMQDRAEALQ
jgi:probable selenium-dependent hydroxylase accessory protein YqeC